MWRKEFSVKLSEARGGSSRKPKRIIPAYVLVDVDCHYSYYYYLIIAALASFSIVGTAALTVGSLCWSHAIAHGEPYVAATLEWSGVLSARKEKPQTSQWEAGSLRRLA